MKQFLILVGLPLRLNPGRWCTARASRGLPTGSSVRSEAAFGEHLSQPLDAIGLGPSEQGNGLFARDHDRFAAQARYAEGAVLLWLNGERVCRAAHHCHMAIAPRK